MTPGWTMFVSSAFHRKTKTNHFRTSGYLRTAFGSQTSSCTTAQVLIFMVPTKGATVCIFKILMFIYYHFCWEKKIRPHHSFFQLVDSVQWWYCGANPARHLPVNMQGGQIKWPRLVIILCDEDRRYFEIENPLVFFQLLGGYDLVPVWWTDLWPQVWHLDQPWELGNPSVICLVCESIWKMKFYGCWIGIIAWLSLNFILKTSWVALYSVACLWGIGVTWPNLHFFNIYRHKSPILTQYH